jgi:hypothetical protein
MKYTNQADLLIAAGESIKMQEKAGITASVCKFRDSSYLIKYTAFDTTPSDYEFPLAVVEGKPVFVGDKLYDLEFSGEDKSFIVDESYMDDITDAASWLPPKPKTIMVELLREDVESFVNTLTHGRISDAIRKALEN